MEYTKGEWKIVNRDVPAPRKRIVANGEPIADIWPGHENDANLIAASPQLYEQLKKLSGIVEVLIENGHINKNSIETDAKVVWLDAQRAINQVEGKA